MCEILERERERVFVCQCVSVLGGLKEDQEVKLREFFFLSLKVCFVFQKHRQ